MKLLTKTGLYFFVASVAVFIAGGFIFQYHLHDILEEESEEILVSEKESIKQFIRKYNRLPKNEVAIGDRLSAVQVAGPVIEKFTDTLIYNQAEEEMHPYRILVFPVEIERVYYKISILSPLIEKEDFLTSIFISFIYLTLILLFAIAIIATVISRIILKPFYFTLNSLEQYNVGKPLHNLPETSITEFKQLKDAVEKMVSKTERSYHELKSFTENASHEIRTPLAILATTTEQLIQGSNLTEQQHAELSKLIQTVDRLNRLNQALMLLAKIENRQFDNNTVVNLSELISKKAERFAEMAALKSIHIHSEISPGIVCKIHPELAEILIGNLLTNAIRHTTPPGEIAITLDSRKLSIHNTGSLPIQHPEKIFDRFYKENITSESTGLGLAIVKQIAETAGMQIGYSFEKRIHTFYVIF